MQVTYFQHLASHRHDDFFQPFVSGSLRAQNSTCMCHGSGAISSLFLLVILRVATVEIRGCRTSIASAPTTAGLGTGSDGTAECASRRRACVGRSSDQDYTTGPSAPAGWTTWYSSWTGGGYSCTREAGQVGRQREGMAQLEFRDESLRGSHRPGFRDDCGMQSDAVSNDTMTGEKKARSVQLYFVLIMLCTGRALDRIANAPHGWRMEAWRMLFQAYSPKNNARLVVMMLGVLAFPLDTNDVVNSLETMEREDQRVREIREHRNSGIPEHWRRDSSSRRRTDENASHHELAQIGNIPGHQHGSDKRQSKPRVQ